MGAACRSPVHAKHRSWQPPMPQQITTCASHVDSFLGSCTFSHGHDVNSSACDNHITTARLVMQVKGYPTLKVMHQGEELKAYRGERRREGP